MSQTKVYWLIFKGILKKQISKRYSKEFTKDLLKKTKAEYNAMISRAPDIGGKENKLIMNIYAGGIFIACYKAADKAISPEIMGDIILDGLKQSKIVKFVCKGQDQTTQKFKNWVSSVSKWTQENADKYPANWIMREDNSKHSTGTYFEFSRCGLCELCKLENCTELAPYLCETDYVTASFGKSKLIRKSTLAEGASCCDFWYVNK